MKYVDVPRQINIKEIIANKSSFSPSLYKKIILKNKNYKKVKNFLTSELVKGQEVGSNSYISKSHKFFIRNKSLQPESFLPTFVSDSVVPILPFTFINLNLKEGDLIISKDSNIGETVILDKDYSDYMLSGGLYKMPVEKNNYYLLAFLKHSFFKAQLDFLASRGATIRHAKTLFLDCLIPFPNQSNANDVIKFVEILTQSVINKEKEIRRKNELIHSLIEKELLENQKPNKFKYELPNIKEIKKYQRIDTGLYKKEFKEFNFIIENYKYGYEYLTNLGYKTKRGQNLQVSCIGHSIYSDKYIKGFYKLITNTDLTDYKTHKEYRYLGNSKKNLQRVQHGDIMFSATGQATTSVGNVCVFVNPPNNLISNINSFFIYNPMEQDIERKIFTGMVLSHYKRVGFIMNIIGFGQGGSFTNKHFQMLTIPNFPKSKQQEIAKLYYNHVSYNTDKLNLDNFLSEDKKITDESGILQLDEQIKTIKEHLNFVIDQIINDDEVKIIFEFLKKLNKDDKDEQDFDNNKR